MVPGERGQEVQLLDSASQPGRPTSLALLKEIGASMAHGGERMPVEVSLPAHGTLEIPAKTE